MLLRRMTYNLHHHSKLCRNGTSRLINVRETIPTVEGWIRCYMLAAVSNQLFRIIIWSWNPREELLMIGLGRLPLFSFEDRRTVGVECCGEVSRIGSAVKHHKIGDMVLAMLGGGIARWLNFHEKASYDLPTTLSFEERSGLIETKQVGPLPCAVFSYNDYHNALRFMMNGQHRGKVVVSTPPGAGESLRVSDDRLVYGLGKHGSPWTVLISSFFWVVLV
jgi:hypothetical protein